MELIRYIRALSLFAVSAVMCFGQSAGVTNVTVGYSSTPTFTANAGVTNFDITLAGPVTSSTFASAAVGIGSFKICAAGFSFVWPAGALGFGTVDPTVGKCSRQSFKWDGAVLQATGPMVTDGTSAGGIPGLNSAATLTAVTSVGSPGTDANIPTEQAVRTALSAAGTVGSVTVAGTANQITVAGSCTGTTTISCTLSLPSGLQLPGTINKLTFTQPATGATITVLNGKTITVNKTLTFDGTDGTTLTFPATSATIFGSTTKTDVLQAADFCLDAGTTAAYACNPSPAITAYVTGARYRFKANTTNASPPTINLNALGPRNIVKVTGGITTALGVNDIRAGQWVECVYDGANCQMTSQTGNAPSGGGDMLTATYNQSASGVPSGACTPGSFKSDTSTTPNALYRCNVPGTGYDGPFSLYDPTKSGASLWSGVTSGASGFAARDVAGTAILYYMPVVNGTAGQTLVDSGAISCETLAAGMPSVCHQLVWVGTGSYAVGAGAANAQTAAYTPANTALVAGLRLCWKPVAANTTTTPTFSPDGLTARVIVKAGGPLVANDIVTTSIACAIYNTTGTRWELQNAQTATGASLSVVGGGSLTSTALVTGGGTTTLQTPAPTATMDGSGNISTPGSFTAASISTGAGTVAALFGVEQTLSAAAAQFAGVPGMFISSTDHLAKVIDGGGVLTGVMVSPDSARTANQFCTHVSTAGVCTKAAIAGADLPLPTSSTLGAVMSKTPCGTGLHINSLGTDGVFTCTADATTGGSVSVTTKGDLQGYNTGAARIPVGTNGQALVADSAQTLGLKWADKPVRSVKILFDAGEGALLTAGAIVRCGLVDYGGTIQAATIAADVADSAVVDVKTVAYGSYTGPASAASIAASAKPTLSSAITAQDGTLTGWTTALAANTYVCFSMTGPTVAKWVEVDLKVLPN